MTYFLTEDKADSPFVRLFNSAYPSDVLISAKNNAKLISRARRLALDGSFVIVYVDVVPDNPALATVFNRLVDLHLVDKLNVIPFPIVCAEYLFIMSICSLNGPVTIYGGLQEILSKSKSYASSSLAMRHSSESSKTFERFCKLFCRECLKTDCCGMDCSLEDARKKLYFSSDCKCDDCQVRLTKEQKAHLYLDQFPVVPLGLNRQQVKATVDYAVSQHRKFVSEFNAWVDLWEMYDSSLVSL